MRIFIGNLPFSIGEDDLRKCFEQFGRVERAGLVLDRVNRKSRGFAFIDMPNDAEATRAIAELHDAEWVGRKLTVRKAEPRPARV